jgi:predicted enzyme related to lactoylglutathione lyase
MSDATFYHVKLFVGDSEGVARFYREVFGMTEVRRYDLPEATNPHLEIFLSVGPEGSEHQLVLMQYLNRPTPKMGESAVGFMVKDVDAVVGAALARGGACTKPAETLEEHKFRWAIIADPEGHSIEVMQFVS